ncbi:MULTISPECIES: hypothetical protein [Candidatus Williamhamiltonella]|nr:hypothetical protein [Candidatus Hamiltonella defensa]
MKIFSLGQLDTLMKCDCKAPFFTLKNTKKEEKAQCHHRFKNDDIGI